MDRSVSQCGNASFGGRDELKDEGSGMCGVVLTVWPL